jgi:hypothetical protein
MEIHVIIVYSVNGSVVLTKSDLWLANVDKTSDLSKPVSTAQQTLLDLKVDKATKINNKKLSSYITLLKSDVGLSNVDNTSDLNKPVSTATESAINNILVVPYDNKLYARCNNMCQNFNSFIDAPYYVRQT